MRKMYLCALFVLATGVLLALSGCEGPTGAEGPQGESGVEECMTCHGEDTGLLAIEAQWAASIHAIGGNFERNTPPCSGCHTHEGFLARLATGSPGTVTNPSPIHCFTCHEPHTNGDFRLRTDVPVNLMLGGAFDMGHGNLCANCHQGLVPSPAVAAAPDSTTITSSRWGPHHGTQSGILSGTGGHEFAGYDYEDSPHASVVINGCPSCHMAAPFGAKAGGHNMSMTYEFHGSENELISGCNVQDCHWGAVLDFNYKGARAEVTALLEQLRTELLNRGLIDASSLVVPGKYSEAEAGAIFNFLYVEEDRSEGIHNTDYAKALLESSLAELGVVGPVASDAGGAKHVKRALK